MKLQIKMLFLLSIVCLFLSGCAACEPQVVERIKIEKIYIYEKCEPPIVPEYKKMNVDVHLGSAYNVNILLDNLTILVDYNKAMADTITCYENQTK